MLLVATGLLAGGDNQGFLDIWGAGLGLFGVHLLQVVDPWEVSLVTFVGEVVLMVWLLMQAVRQPAQPTQPALSAPVSR